MLRTRHSLAIAAAAAGRAAGLVVGAAACAVFCAAFLSPPAAARAAPALPDPVASVSGADSLGGEELPPLGTGPSWMIGSALLEQGDAAGALPYLRLAWQLSGGRDRQVGQAYLHALLALGLHGEALGVLERLRAAAPDDLDLALARIRLLAALDRPQEALEALAELRRGGAGAPDELLLMEADLLTADGRPEEALEVLRRALNLLPERREAIYRNMAALLERTATPAELADFWAEAVAAVPESGPLQAGRLHQLVTSGRIDEAVAVARALDQDPRLAGGPAPTWEVQVAELLTREGNVPRAIDVLRERRGRGEKDPETALWLGRLLLSRDDLAGATPLLEESSRANPADGTADYFLGEALLVSVSSAPAATDTTLVAAEAHLREAVRREPRRPEFLTALLRSLLLRHGPALGAGEDQGTAARPDSMAAGPRREIRDLARRAGDVMPAEDYRGHLLLGLAWRAVDDPGAAVPEFEAAAAGSQTFKSALLQLALCLDETDQPVKALAALEKLHERLPDDAEVANSLGYYLADKNQDLERAEKLIRQALKAEPRNGAYLDSLGWVLYRLGRHQEAFDSLVEAANAVPDDPIVLEHLGFALAALDRPVEALRALRRAREAGGDGEGLLEAIRKLEAAQAGPGAKPAVPR